MICSNAAMLVAARALSPALISGLALSRITRMAAVLPDCATGHILELRPARIDGQVDLSQVYLPGPDGIGRLARDASAARIAPFLDACADLAIPLIWLEHDLDGAGAAPSLFFAPPAVPSAPLAGTLRAALSRLPVTAAQIDAVAAMPGRLPPGLRLRQVGVMVPRPGRPVRLVLDPVPARDLAGHLHALGWPGDGAAARALLAHPAFHGAALRADLDMHDALAPELGLELSMLGMDPARARAIVSSLAADGAITAQAAAALSRLAGPRVLHVPSGKNDAPGLEGRVELRLNHLKAQLGAQGGFSVKAYLSVVAPSLFPPQAPARMSGAEK